MLWLVNAIVAVVVALCVVALVQVGQVTGWISSEAASWVQAITSFIAILASAHLALLVPTMERRHNRLVKLIGFRNLAAVAVKYVVEVSTQNEPGVDTWRYRRRRDLCMKAIDPFPNGDIQPPSLIFAFSEIRLHCDRFWAEFMEPRPDQLEAQDTILRRCRESKDELLSELAKVDFVLRHYGAKFRDGISYAPHEGVLPPPPHTRLQK